MFHLNTSIKQSSFSTFIILFLMACSLIVTSITPASAKSKQLKADDILGVWQTYDDKTGNPKALIEIKYIPKTKSYIGRIKKVTPAAGYTPKKYCQNCPKPFTNKKIEGMMVFWNLKPRYKNGKFKDLDNGYLIDPLSGKIYRFKIQLSSNKRILKTRGYVGVALIGRSQTWRKVK